MCLDDREGVLCSLRESRNVNDKGDGPYEKGLYGCTEVGRGDNIPTSL